MWWPDGPPHAGSRLSASTSPCSKPAAHRWPRPYGSGRSRTSLRSGLSPAALCLRTASGSRASPPRATGIRPPKVPGNPDGGRPMRSPPRWGGRLLSRWRTVVEGASRGGPTRLCGCVPRLRRRERRRAMRPPRPPRPFREGCRGRSTRFRRFRGLRASSAR